MNDDITQITLKYLAKNVYQVNKNNEDIDDRKDVKFYKKRLYSLFKNMIKGEYPNNTIKEIHLDYIKSLINYIKIMDKHDILQKDYAEDSSEHIKNESDKPEMCEYSVEYDAIEHDASFNLDTDINKIMMNIPHKTNTIDYFVEKKIIKITEDAELSFPKIKNINIKTREHRTKGITKT